MASGEGGGLYVQTWLLGETWHFLLKTTCRDWPGSKRMCAEQHMTPGDLPSCYLQPTLLASWEKNQPLGTDRCSGIAHDAARCVKPLLPLQHTRMPCILQWVG